MATGQLQDSSKCICESKWSKFAIWCARQDLDPEQAPVSRVCYFFLFLFEHERLSPPSIEGYWSAINSVCGASGHSLGDSFHVTRLFKSFRVDRPHSAISFLRWDLNLVLRVLTCRPFHPADGSRPFCISAKMVFLLLLASACCCGDIHAIDPNCVTFTSSATILEPSPRYLLKICNTAEGEARYAPIVIRSFRSVTSDPTEPALCPVAALRAYDAYARRKSPQRSQFFVSLWDDGHPASKATISAWVVKL